MVAAPMLLLAFNRPHLLKELITNLRKHAPPRIYLAVDGPRIGNLKDRAATLECQDAVRLIDWPCDVSTRFRETNLGCALGVSDAISWFFANEERGIILEDDIRPCDSFFDFCEACLAKYETDSRVWAIAGCNFVPSTLLDLRSDYRFTRITNVWGWASWRRTWNEYRHDISDWRKELPLVRLARVCNGSWESVVFWSVMFDLVKRGVVDSWAFRFILAAMRTDGLTLNSNHNLITNVGIGDDATHTRVAPAPLPEVVALQQPFRPPVSFAVDVFAENWMMRNVMGATAFGLSRQCARFVWREIRKRVRTGGISAR